MKSNLEDCGRLLADVSEKLKKFVERWSSLPINYEGSKPELVQNPCNINRLRTTFQSLDLD